MNFKQAMIVPTMASLGMGALLVAQHLSLVDASYAAPPMAPAVAPGVPGAGAPAGAPGTAAAPGPGALPVPSDKSAPANANSPEFARTGGPEAPRVFRAVTEAELANQAVESSGREDPFMSLVPPDPASIVLPTPVPTATPPGGPTGNPLGQLPKLPQVVKAQPSAKPIEKPWAGEKAPPPQEPQWLVRGVMSVGTERMTLLEGKDESLYAHVGDVLRDGSKVEAISNRGVTFLRSGHRFDKLIGG